MRSADIFRSPAVIASSFHEGIPLFSVGTPAKSSDKAPVPHGSPFPFGMRDVSVSHLKEGVEPLRLVANAVGGVHGSRASVKLPTPSRTRLSIDFKCASHRACGSSKN